MRARWGGLLSHIVRCIKHCNGDVDKFNELYAAYLDHCAGNHCGCFDGEKGFGLVGDAPYKGKARVLSDPDLAILWQFMYNPKLTESFPQLLHGFSTSNNESLHNVINIYREKGTPYKHHDLLYQMVSTKYHASHSPERSRHLTTTPTGSAKCSTSIRHRKELVVTSTPTRKKKKSSIPSRWDGK